MSVTVGPGEGVTSRCVVELRVCDLRTWMTADTRHVSRDIGIFQVERYQCELGGLCFGVLLGAVDPARFWQGEDFGVGGRGEAFGVPGTGGRESR